MCGRRRHEHAGDRWASGSLLDRDSTLQSDRLVSDAERETALAALRRHTVAGGFTVEEFAERSEAALASRNVAQLHVALDGVPRPVRASEGGSAGRGGRPRWMLLAVPMLVVAALVATHGWAFIPVAWLLFGFFGPWRRPYGRHLAR